MPGTLVVSTLSDGTNSTSATDAIRGSSKTFVNFNGVTTASIRLSYNVSSVTRNGTGDYTLNLTNALADANYSVVYTPGSGATGSYFSVNGAVAAPTTTACRVVSGTVTSTVVDSAYSYVAIFR